MKVSKEDIDIYTNLVIEFQPDLIYIIRRFRRNFHILSEKEILSEVNRRLILHKSKYISRNRDCLTKKGFSKFAYACAKNAVFWTMKGYSTRDTSYRKMMVSCSFDNNSSEESADSAWNHKVVNLAKEESHVDLLDKPEKVNVIIKWIQEYSDFLTEKEMLVFNDYISGKPQRETAITINETRQSVASIQKTVSEKIKSHIKTKINKDNFSTKIKKGYESINHLFG